MNYYIPQWEERTSYGFRRIDPYAKLFEDRIIFLGTPISDDVANAVMAQLLCLESMDPDRDIQIYINSPGGSFTAMTAIYDTMQFIQPDVQTVCLGQAASAAAILLAAGAPGKRMALPNSRILIHQPYTEGTYGQSSDIEIQANEILRMREQLEQMIADHSGKTRRGGQPRHRARQDPHRGGRGGVRPDRLDPGVAQGAAGRLIGPGRAGRRVLPRARAITEYGSKQALSTVCGSRPCGSGAVGSRSCRTLSDRMMGVVASGTDR